MIAVYRAVLVPQKECHLQNSLTRYSKLMTGTNCYKNMTATYRWVIHWLFVCLSVLTILDYITSDQASGTTIRLVCLLVFNYCEFGIFCIFNILLN